jgi:hypothetical protein
MKWQFSRIKFRNSLIAWFPGLAARLEWWRAAREIWSYRQAGIGYPLPSFLKRSLLRREARRIGATAFVETGTYMGDSLWTFRKEFTSLQSIEVQPDLAKIAALRFRAWSHIRIIPGDSAEQLAKLVGSEMPTTLFWLDGHYSAGITGKGETDCPIDMEIAALERAKGRFSILIDDARLFGTDPSYPQAGEFKARLARLFPSHTVEQECDIIIVRPHDARA